MANHTDRNVIGMSNLQDAKWHYTQMREQLEREQAEAAKEAHPAQEDRSGCISHFTPCRWRRHRCDENENGRIGRRLVAGIALAVTLAIGAGACGSQHSGTSDRRPGAPTSPYAGPPGPGTGLPGAPAAWETCRGHHPAHVC